MVTIKDVAKLAGVSTGTVSNMLSGKRPVAKITRQRIIDVINTLGYTPNLLARGLINRHSFSLGVITTNLELQGTSSTLVGIEQKANEFGYSLDLRLLHKPEHLNPKLLIDSFKSRQVDGLIWAVPEIGDNMEWIADYSANNTLPIVFIFTKPRPNILMVNTNHRQGAFKAVEHLINTGRKKIAIISGPLTWWISQERLLGYQDALGNAGIAYDKNFLIDGNWSPADGVTGVELLLKLHPEIDAIFAGNDQMALGAMWALHKLGKEIPGDVSIIGYNNIPESQHFWPPLSTVDPHHQLLGSLAVEKLLYEINCSKDNKKDLKPNNQVYPQLIIRQSSSLN